MWIVGLCVLFLLLLWLASRSNTPREEELPRQPHQSSFSRIDPGKRYFINSQLAKREKKAARHKQNQYPW